MDENRKTQRKNAIVFGAVLLIVILLAVLIWQVSSILIKNAQYDELVDKVEEYNALILDGKSEVELKEKEEWIIMRARQLDYYFGDDKQLHPASEENVADGEQ